MNSLRRMQSDYWLVTVSGWKGSILIMLYTTNASYEKFT